MGDGPFYPDARAGGGDALTLPAIPVGPPLAAPSVPTVLDRMRGEFGEPPDHWRYEVLINGAVVDRVVRADAWRGYVDVFPSKTKVAELKQYTRRFGTVEIRERDRP